MSMHRGLSLGLGIVLSVLILGGSPMARASVASSVDVAGRLGDSYDKDSVDLVQEGGKRVRIPRSMLPPNTPMRPGTPITVKMTLKQFYELKTLPLVEQEKPTYTGGKRK